MYNIKRRTQLYDTEDPQDMLDYDDILNDPLCTVIREIKEKVSDREFGDEGQLTNIHEHIVLVVTWDQKILL